MDIALSVLTALLLFAQGPLYKIYNKKCLSAGPANDFLLNLFNFGTGLVALIPLALINNPFDPISFLWGTANGVLFCSMLVLYNKSLQLGKIAFVNFMMALAMAVPLIGGMALFGETISAVQWIGLAVLVAASYLVSYGQKDKSEPQSDDARHGGKKKNAKLWILVVAGMLCNGGLSLFIKVSHYKVPGLNQPQFLMGSFLTAFAAMALLTALTTKGFSTARGYIPNKWFVILGVAIGIVTVLGNTAFTFISVITPPTTFYPMTGALPMLLAACISPLLKEKLSLMAIIGVVLGTAAIILLNL